MITRDSLIIMRDRLVTTTLAPGSVADHFISDMRWSPNQRMIATLSASPRVKVWLVTDALKGFAEAGDAHGNNGECCVSLHGHLRYPQSYMYQTLPFAFISQSLTC